MKLFCFLFLLLLAIEDFRTYKISQNLLIVFFTVVFGLNICFNFFLIPNLFLNALFFYVLFFLISFFTQGLGLGDVKVIGILAFATGFFEIISICLVASVLGLAFFFVRKLCKDKNKKMPFVTCVFASYIINCALNIYLKFGFM